MKRTEADPKNHRCFHNKCTDRGGAKKKLYTKRIIEIHNLARIECAVSTQRGKMKNKRNKQTTNRTYNARKMYQAEKQKNRSNTTRATSINIYGPNIVCTKFRLSALGFNGQHTRIN